jgi:acyl carrier protein
MTRLLDRAEVLAGFTEIVGRLTAQADLVLEERQEFADLEALDSLRLLEAIALTELRFGVQIDTAGMDRLTTVGDVVGAVLTAAR